MKKSLGIIGLGQFSQFMIPYLKPYFADIFVANRSDKSKIAADLGVNFVSIEEASQKDILILAMSISEIKNVAEKIKKHIKPETIVMDVCSIKIYPLKTLRQILPAKTKILGTHPLFGPQSGKNGLKNLEIILCPAAIGKTELEEIKNIFSKMKLKTIMATPDEHDKTMAYTQALTHFFAQAAIKTFPKTNFNFSTPSAKKLFDIINSVRYDSPELFHDLETLNPYAKKMRVELLKNLNQINKKLL